MSARKKVSQEYPSVGIISREHQTFRFNQFFHPTVFLLQALYEYFLKEILFKKHINRTDIPEVKRPIKTCHDYIEVPALNLEMQAEILAPLGLKRDFGRETLLKTFSHFNSCRKSLPGRRSNNHVEENMFEAMKSSSKLNPSLRSCRHGSDNVNNREDLDPKESSSKDMDIDITIPSNQKYRNLTGT